MERPAVRGVTKVGHNLVTEQQKQQKLCSKKIYSSSQRSALAWSLKNPGTTFLHFQLSSHYQAVYQLCDVEKIT